MKKLSSFSKTAVVVCSLVMFVLLLSQCTKQGTILKDLDRSFTGVPDSGIFASYYDTMLITPASSTPDVNDIIRTRGVESIIKDYCASSNCHGGPIKPVISSYNDILKYITPGNPEGSKLWEYITTNDFNKAMPPGAKQRPDLGDFRPAAIKLITMGCGSANCHSQVTATGGWARKGIIPGLVSADTGQFVYINPQTGVQTVYCQLINTAKRDQVWTSYKDSVKKFYADTLANASFRPYKTFATPISALSTRGPLNTYDDILMDIMYPKSARSNSTVQYTDPVTGVKYYSKGNYLNVTSSLITRIDSTLLLANPFTGVYATNHQGDMAYGDGGLKSHEIALIKAWYFADPNVPDVWKYGVNNAGIFKYRKSGLIIKK
jgi:hypothetical protein